VLTTIAILLLGWDYSQKYFAKKSFKLKVPIENEFLKKYGPWFVKIK